MAEATPHDEVAERESMAEARDEELCDDGEELDLLWLGPMKIGDFISSFIPLCESDDAKKDNDEEARFAILENVILSMLVSTTEAELAKIMVHMLLFPAVHNVTTTNLGHIILV